MGEWLSSQRDGVIVAWHEVPGAAPTEQERPVGYGLICVGVLTDSMIGVMQFAAEITQKRSAFIQTLKQ
jgi:hypothetical protein